MRSTAPHRLLTEVDIGPGARIADFTNLCGCRIGAETRVGPFVEIQRGACVGAHCEIQSHTFICEAVDIGDEVYVGHGVMFVQARQHDGVPLRTVVARGASVGSGAIVLGGVQVGAGALVGPGAVITRDVAPGATVAGVPARVVVSDS